MDRLFVIPARFAPTAVILGSGPTPWYHVIQWDTRRDRLEHGAWIKARIFENRCDLSPDGQLLVAFIHQRNRGGTEFTYAWTAVSRSPWLHALIVWPQGSIRGGGGRFIDIDNRSLALRDVFDKPLPEYPLRGIRTVEGSTHLHQSTDDVPDADWCGRDFGGRIIFTRGGQLFRRRKENDTLIADFTDLQPDPQPAPDWAREPL